MARVESTGFSDVDASRRAPELIDYLETAARLLAEQRRATYELMKVGPGSAVLDVGCGAGEVCVELAAKVGASGRVAGVDLSAAMIAAARSAAAAAGRPVELREASADALPFPDATFDAVRAERVLQHLEDPAAALREMVRVTRPGGRVIVVDPDHGQMGIGLDDPEHRRVYDASLRAMLRMIVNPHSGTRLRPMLHRAGLTDLLLHVIPLELGYPQYEQLTLLGRRLSSAIESGEITADEATRFTAHLEARSREGAFFGNVVAYLAVGTKPA